MVWPGVTVEVFAAPDGVELEPMLPEESNQAMLTDDRKRKDKPVLDLLSHGQEGLLNVGRILGGCLQEGDAQRIGEFLQVRGFRSIRTHCRSRK